MALVVKGAFCTNPSRNPQIMPAPCRFGFRPGSCRHQNSIGRRATLAAVRRCLTTWHSMVAEYVPKSQSKRQPLPVA